MTRARPIIAIDGPVGAGKSTVARELARALGFSYINTGAMYRAVALVARESGISPGDAQIERRLAGILDMIAITFDGERVRLSSRDITAAIAAPEVGDLASRLSTLAIVRRKMRELQRAAGRDGGAVMEGRDIGTAVFPDAEFKFFLDADVEVRAERRWRELVAKGASVTRDEVLAQLLERDRRDSERELAPLRRADDAIVIDSTRLSIAEVVAAMKARVEAASRALKGLKPT
jgi:cytidylate kinase